MKSLKVSSLRIYCDAVFPVDGQLHAVTFTPMDEGPTLAQEIHYELSLLIAGKIIVQTHGMGWHKSGFKIVLKQPWPFKANDTLRLWVHPHPMYRDLLENREPPTPPVYNAELEYE